MVVSWYFPHEPEEDALRGLADLRTRHVELLKSYSWL